MARAGGPGRQANSPLAVGRARAAGSADPNATTPPLTGPVDARQHFASTSFSIL